jgi:hypothetical protein
MGGLALALTLPQPAEADGRPQLWRLGVLTASDLKRLLKAGFNLPVVGATPSAQQLALQAIQLGLVEKVSPAGQRRQRLGYGRESLLDQAEAALGFGQYRQKIWVSMAMPNPW